MIIHTYKIALNFDHYQCVSFEAGFRALPRIRAASVSRDGIRLFVDDGFSYAKGALLISKYLGEHLAGESREYIESSTDALTAHPVVSDEITAEFNSHRRGAVSAVLVLLGFEALRRLSPTLFASTTLLRSALVLLLSRELLVSGIRDAVAQRRPNADSLTVTAIMASIFAGKPESSLSLLALSHVSEALTLMAAQKARRNIKDLVDLEVQEVWVVGEAGVEIRTPIEEVRPGMGVAIHSGEKICIDGVVTDGEAAVDQSPITGESMPVTKRPGDTVYAGSNVRLGELRVQVQRVGDETSLARIVHMVEEAHNRRAPIQNYADRMATSLVPVSFIAAAVVFAVTRDWQRVLNMLFIDFSCGLKLSTATAISAAISRAAQQGILVKGGSFIEEAAGIDTVILDKTGTITEGRPCIVRTTTCGEGVDDTLLLQLAAAAELQSSHPMATAIVDEARRRGLDIPLHDGAKTVMARGMEAQVRPCGSFGGGEVLVGSDRFMRERGLQGLPDVERSTPTGSLIYVAAGGRLCGVLEVSDPIREEFRRCLNRLRHIGIEEIVMLTGDNEAAAQAIAGQLGLDGYQAEVMPEDKAGFVANRQTRGSVLMVGDGINDAPALAYANIGVAMGTACTDTAMESADVTINSEDPLKLPEFIAIGRQTMHIVHQNFAVTIAINTAAMMLGALGYITPLLASVVHNASTLGVVLNSGRVMIDTRKKA